MKSSRPLPAAHDRRVKPLLHLALDAHDCLAVECSLWCKSTASLRAVAVVKTHVNMSSTPYFESALCALEVVTYVTVHFCGKTSRLRSDVVSGHTKCTPKTPRNTTNTLTRNMHEDESLWLLPQCGLCLTLTVSLATNSLICEAPSFHSSISLSMFH